MKSNATSSIIVPETAATVLGVDGRFFNRVAWDDCNIWANQKFSATRVITRDGAKLRVSVKLCFDDEFRNGHADFSATCEIDEARGGQWREYGGGADHDTIAAAFPEFAHLLKWHLSGMAGPMHYVANTVYLAGDRDHNGKRKGEPWAFDDAVQFGSNPIKHKLSSKFAAFLRAATSHPGKEKFDFEVIGIDHNDRQTYGTKYTFGGFADKWHECPFNTEGQAIDFLYALQHCAPAFVQIPTLFSGGKGRDLKAARRAAVWPEATDEELSVEPAELKAKLEARLPGLIAACRADMEAAGFIWTPKPEESTNG